MQQFQQSMDIIGNNIANVNTTGYKSARIDFADALSQTVRAAGPGGSMQVGTGVGTDSISSSFAQGAISQTGGDSYLAIDGGGFFVVRDTLSGAEYATRAGDFKLDSTGFLITAGGMRVQGFTDGTLTTRGDIQINGTGTPGDPAAGVSAYGIDDLGKINMLMSDGTEFVRGQVLMQNFQSPQSLVKEGANLYSNLAAAGALAQTEAAGTNGMGSIKSGQLETSNVDLATEFTSLITTQRAFQASARIITTSDEILQELVNLKR
jgi:flagellar hook protein FlgE